LATNMGIKVVIFSAREKNGLQKAINGETTIVTPAIANAGIW